LVAGAGGFIGSHLVRVLLASGDRVIALSPRPVNASDGATWIDASTVTGNVLTNLFDLSHGVIWLAGTSTPSSSAGRPIAELDSNLRPLLNLIEASRGVTNRRVVYLSTGGAIYGDVEVRDATEQARLEPKAYYSAGKLAAEAFLSAWSHEQDHHVTILRPSNVYGPGQPYRNGFGIVPTAFHAVQTGQPIFIRGDGSAIRDYLFVDDLVDLITKALSQPIAAGFRTINASSYVPVSVNTLLGLVSETVGQTVPREYHDARAFDVHRIVLDNALARATFNWVPRIDLRDGLERTWRAAQ
jgi:UDP-glucose 4-epimerase